LLAFAPITHHSFIPLILPSVLSYTHNSDVAAADAEFRRLAAMGEVRYNNPAYHRSPLSGREGENARFFTFLSVLWCYYKLDVSLQRARCDITIGVPPLATLRPRG
jgi:hypothetical protein